MRKPAAALSLLAALAAAPMAWGALPVGATAPDFSTSAAMGGQVFQFSMAQALREGPVVLYFYPAAFTAGCTVEAHDFAEATDQYRELGARVVGVSADGIDVLQRFSVSACQSKFAVAADADQRIMQTYDAVHDRNPERAQRISYVIVPPGKVIYSYTDSNPEHHVANTLDALRQWRRGNAQQ
ncbi:peroxiredoxin [Bordetella genomosp. 8]|uniref:thioredoxin-dependent peroxiredoxin n=1 Tax=Bordetella genomosp. 8 TaxID=1416806 RepID=A0A1W6YM05_9BORD|nr:peroxiredoxin [Bordetella genomosp. 8]ARP82092.1 peroxiredoxin [Bordetella genomosp. 8]